MNPALDSLSKKLAKLATHYDLTGEWPVYSLDHLTQAGAWTWVIPRPFGGMGLDPLLQAQGYEAVAAGCMSTLLILTQRDGACEFIAESANDALKAELLPRLAMHEFMISLGISQLTTSHQTGRPALTAKPDGENFVLHGFSPWVTGAAQCQYLVIGATPRPTTSSSRGADRFEGDHHRPADAAHGLAKLADLRGALQRRRRG
jgi:alkylation response protein AidB-like acyl-CoA dehydrogenase